MTRSGHKNGLLKKFINEFCNMNKGLIKIIGGIGSYTAPDGKFVKGVDLTDVIAQVRSQGEVDGYNVIVKSMGGLVTVGYDIYNYLKGLKKPITTIIDKQSASIATVVSLAGDKGSRLIVEGSEFFIHNPWINPDPGTADQLSEVAASIKETEKDLVSFYADNTGVSKEGISPLMREETGLTPEKAVELGFCDKVITKAEAALLGVTIEAQAQPLEKAFALIVHKNKPNTNQNMDTLKEIKATIGEIAKKIGLKIKGAAEVVALDWKTSDTGVTVSFESAGEVPAVGDSAMIEGQAAADGTYNFEGGYVVVVTGGKVESIVEAAASEETPEALKAKIAELEKGKTALKAESEANKAEIAELAKQVTEIGKHITTNYKVPGGGAKGNKGEGAGKQVISYSKTKLEAKRAELAAKNTKK